MTFSGSDSESDSVSAFFVFLAARRGEGGRKRGPWPCVMKTLSSEDQQWVLWMWLDGGWGWSRADLQEGCQAYVAVKVQPHLHLQSYSPVLPSLPILATPKKIHMVLQDHC